MFRQKQWRRVALVDAKSQRTTLLYNAAGQQLSVRDAAGNRTRVKDVLGELTTWTYDKAYRLSRERHAGTVTYDTTYTYDPAGNRTLKTATGARTTYSYNVGNQLTRLVDSSGVTTFSYDANGNQTKKRAQAGAAVSITTYTWDYENRLTKALLPGGTRNTFTYNADAQRVKVERPTETRKQIWDEARIIEETDGADALQTNYRQEPAGFGNLMTQRRGTLRDMIHSDALGSTAIITHHTDDTIVRARIWYDAWANPVKTSGTPTITPMRFVGRLGYYYDPDTGLYLLSARYYDPVTGRFVSTDPLGDVDGPNLYVYVADNPVNAAAGGGVRAKRWPRFAGCRAFPPVRPGHPVEFTRDRHRRLTNDWGMILSPLSGLHSENRGSSYQGLTPLAIDGRP